MVAIDPMDQLKELDSTLTAIESVLDLDAMRRDIATLREESADPELWSDQERALDVIRRLGCLKGELRRVEGLRRRLDDVSVLYELAEAEDDADTREEAGRELEWLVGEIQHLEVFVLIF